MNYWSNQKTISFLYEVQIRPEVWDVKSEEYKNREARQNGWAVIADKFGITVCDAYRKFKSLRTYAKNEEKKLKRSGDGNKTVKWFAYDAISFILDQDTNGLESVKITQKTETTESQKKAIKVVVEQEEVAESDASGSKIFLKKRQISEVNKPPDPIRTKLRHAPEIGEKNDYAPFGEHIAYKLSKYDPYVRAQAEMKIMQILYDCDMQMLSNDSEELVPVTVLSDSQSD